MIKNDFLEIENDNNKYENLNKTIKKKFTNFENFKIKKKTTITKNTISENFSDFYSIILNNKSLLFVIKYIFKDFNKFFSLIKNNKNPENNKITKDLINTKKKINLMNMIHTEYFINTENHTNNKNTINSKNIINTKNLNNTINIINNKNIKKQNNLLKTKIITTLKTSLLNNKSKLLTLIKHIIDKQNLKTLIFLYSLSIPLPLEKIKTTTENSELIHYLIKYKKNKILNFFLNCKKKNLDIKNKNLETPMVTAFRFNNREGLILLIKKNARIENLYYKDLGIYNALFFSVIRNYKEIIKLLIKKKIDVNFLTKKNESVLFWAISKIRNRDFKKRRNLKILKKYEEQNLINFEIVKILLENSVDLNVENFLGENCLILAIKFRKKKIFEILLNEKHFDFLCVFKAFIFAYKNNFLFEANFIFRKKKKFFEEICRFSNLNFFHFLHVCGNFEICEYLLKKNFFIDKKDKCNFGWDCFDYKNWFEKEKYLGYKMIFSHKLH